MKKTTKKLLTMFLCILTIAFPLASCKSASDNGATSPENSQPSSPDTQSSTNTTTTQSTVAGVEENNITTDSYKEQISYYMTLTESLQAELLKLKEESYIEECEYQLQISALEETVEALRKTVAAMSGGDSSIHSSTPSNDNLSTKSNYKYSVKDGKVTITEYTGNATDVIIPARIDGFTVVAIGDEAFKGAEIRSVVIPSGVTEIGWFAFAGCTILESATIPSSVTSIDYGAFDYCPGSLKIICDKDSYAASYAASWGFGTSEK